MASPAGLSLQEVSENTYHHLEATLPGWYRVVHEPSISVTEDVALDSKQVTELPLGASVEVAEVIHREDLCRIRGRLDQPKGWISLVNLVDGYRYARSAETNPLAVIASVDSSVASQASASRERKEPRPSMLSPRGMRGRALTEGAEPSGRGQPVRAAKRDDAQYWRSNFVYMAILFSMSEATVTTPISYATSLLDPKAGQLGTGGVFLFVVMSSLLIGPITAKSLGAKKGLMFGMSLDTIYAALFALAVDCEKGSLNQWVLYTLGCLCSGIGSGIIWTCQGLFFAASVAQIARCEVLDAQQARAQAASRVFLEPSSRTSIPPPNPSGRQSSRSRNDSLYPAGSIEGQGSNGGPSTFEAPYSMRSSRRSVQSRILASPSLRRALSSASLGHATFSTLWGDSLAGSFHGLLPGCEELSGSLVDSNVIEEREAITAELGGTFAALYLGIDVAMKMSASILQGSFLQWTLFAPLIEVFPMFVLYAVLSLLTVFIVAVALTEPELTRKAPAQESVLTKLKAAFAVWPRPELWCLGMTNFTFGFSAGYINGYVNSAFTAASPVYGAASIGTLMALTSLVAATFALLFGLLSRYTGKGPIVIIGASAFATVPILCIVWEPTIANEYWGVNLVWLYVVQGLGRSVYESTNKAVFADFFPGQESAGAFANCMMQNGLAFFCSFLLQSFLTSSESSDTTDMTAVAWVVLVLAVLTVPGYVCATVLQSRRRKQKAAERESRRQP